MEAHVPTVIHEPERVPRTPIVWVSVWVVLFAVVLCVISFVVFEFRSHTLRGDVTGREAKPGELVSNVRTDLFTGRAGRGEQDKLRQRRELDRFGWVDRERGVVSIPIDTAIELELAEQPQ